MIMRRWMIVVLTIAILLVGVNSPADAQNNRIAYGQEVRGQITRDSFRQVYLFQGQQGDIIEATLTSSDGALDPMLLLTDEQNNLVARDDDSADADNAVISSVRLPSDGLYFLIVTRFGQDRGSTTGGFTLKLNRLGVAASGDRPAGVVLRYGDSIVEEITEDAPQFVYAFAALKGDIITVKMRRISGDLDSLLILADAAGNVLTSSDDDPGSPGTLDAAIIDLRIQQTGNYALIATRFGQEAGTSIGGFSLALNRVPADQLGLTPEYAALLDYGMLVEGSISKDLLRRYYLLQARAGDVLTIEAKRTRGNLDPILELYSGDGTRLLQTNDGGARGVNARITAFRVLLDGYYLLIVSRFNKETGQTAGDYSLVANINIVPTPTPGR
ncbi:MAG: hypothetical protein KF726_09425 [Anaerolineae bacterium]|nr:hypothetical protein [Anaerolineae bacterium]